MTRRSPIFLSLAILGLGLTTAGCDRFIAPATDPTLAAMFTANAPFPTYMAQTAEVLTQSASTTGSTAPAPKGEATTAPPATAAPLLVMSPTPKAATAAPANPTDTAAPAVTSTELPAALPAEAILIQSPGPASRLTSPITVSGLADLNFETHLTVELSSDTNANIDIQPASVEASGAAEPGDRGQFQVTLTFPDTAVSENARITVLGLSARDGHVVHLASASVALVASGGQADIRPAADHADEIVIQTPALGEVVAGGVIHLSGIAAPTFEQTLAVRVLDQTGALVGSGSLTIRADARQTGPFAGDIAYSVTEAQPGSVQVYTVSARDGGLLHLSSVEVTLQP